MTFKPGAASFLGVIQPRDASMLQIFGQKESKSEAIVPSVITRPTTESSFKASPPLGNDRVKLDSWITFVSSHSRYDKVRPKLP